MSRRAKIIIAAIVLLLVALLAAFLWWLYSRQSTTLPPVNTAVNGAVNTNGSLPIVNAPITNVNGSEPNGETPIVVPSGQAAVRRLAMSFAERFGSYSSEGDFTNIEELQPLMTASLRAWAEGYVAQQRAQASANGQFTGVTTRALNAEFSAFDDAGGNADVTVQTQRRETSSTDAEGRVYYQDLRLEFLKQGTTWLVDSVRWGEVSAPQ